MFDCLLANPPYQDDTKAKGSNGRKQSSSKIWPSFIKKAFESAKIVTIVCPASCLKGTKLRGERFMDRVKGGQISEIVIGDRSWFDKIATRNIYFISSDKKLTDVKIDGSIYKVDTLPSFIPIKNTKLSLDIVIKVLKNKNKAMFSDSVGGIKGIKDLNEWKSGYKLWTGGGEGSKSPIFKECSIVDKAERYADIPKVCMPLAGGDKPHFIWDETGHIVCGTSAFIYPLQPNDTFQGAKSYLLSPLITYILKHLRFDGYLNHFIHQIPQIDLSKVWGEDLYKYFGITEEEQSEIEKYV